MATDDIEDVEEFVHKTLKEIELDDEAVTPKNSRRRESDNFPGRELAGTTKYQAVKQEQWGLSTGGTWVAMGPSTKSLNPGLYYAFMDNEGNIHWSKRELISDNLLRLPDSKSDMVISEIETFWGLRNKFKQYGFTHKRGFLLWGPQGSGKTSTVATVIKEMIQRNGLALLGNTNPHVVASALRVLRVVEPDRPIVTVFEDIDDTIRTYGEAEVLSLLDGESSIDNVVFIATTNYPERLEARISNRPSRFDRVVKIGMPSADARKMYIESRNLDLKPNELNVWVEKTANLSIAHIKEIIISVKCFGNDLDETVTRLRAMARLPKSDEGGKMGFGSEPEY